FRPDGKAVLLTTDKTVTRLWYPPQALPGTAERIKLWAQVRTGLELDERGAEKSLDRATWQERRRLDERGGPALPGGRQTDGSPSSGHEAPRHKQPPVPTAREPPFHTELHGTLLIQPQETAGKTRQFWSKIVRKQCNSVSLTTSIRRGRSNARPTVVEFLSAVRHFPRSQ